MEHQINNHMKVTVITPVLNGRKTIGDCILSVQQQDYQNIEHIVIDCCSEDGTAEYARELGVECISEPDTGVYDAFNKGIRRATGEIIHILNADDFYADEGVVGRMVNALKMNGADLCHGYIVQIDENGREIKRVGKDIGKSELLKKMRIAHPSVFVRKTVYEKYGLFSQGFTIAGDHEFLLRIWDPIKISFVPEVAVKMRLGGISNSQVELSYRESMAASLIHGASPLRALSRYYLERIKSKILIVFN